MVNVIRKGVSRILITIAFSKQLSIGTEVEFLKGVSLYRTRRFPKLALT